jgi:ATP-dependent Clp protease protease subunit
MARKVKVDSTTRSRLGGATVADVLARLAPGHCPACDWHFDDEQLSLVVEREGEYAAATLHHFRCTAPGWIDTTEPVFAAPRAAGFMWMSPVTPVFVANPSGEATLLWWVGEKWVVVDDLDEVLAAGLTADPAQVRDVPGLVATVDQRQLTVDLGRRFSWSTDLGPSVAAAIDLAPSVLVVVSHYLDPGPDLTRDRVSATTYPVAFGRARVRFTPQAQRPRLGDVDQKARAKAIVSYADAAVRSYGVDIDESAVLAACEGDPGPIEALTGVAQVLAVLTVAQVYGGSEPAHVLVPDEATVTRFQEVHDRLGGEAVIGTPDQLAEMSGQARLAITVDVDEQPASYRRVLAVRNGRTAEYLRSKPVVDRLLRNRVVVVNGEITDEVANQVTGQLLLLESEDPTADITMYINSSGGPVTSAFAILDTIELIRPAVVTCVMGLAAGTAQLLATAGTPGKRHALPKARLVLVMPKAEPTADPTRLAMYERWAETILGMITSATGQPVERVRTDAERGRSFRAIEAVEYGLIDRVLESPR